MTLELRKVCISDELLHNLLSNCFLLEKLSLIQCQGPFNLNIGGSGSGSSQGRLKFLCIKCCPTLNRIEISSESLASLEYTGILINFSFKYVRNLTETYLYFSTYNGHNGVTYALTRLGSEIPQLKKLDFLSVKSMNVSRILPLFISCWKFLVHNRRISLLNFRYLSFQIMNLYLPMLSC